MKNLKYLIIALLVYSCHGDLDQNPTDPDLFTEVQVYNNAQEAKSALAKVYASFALTGQQGPAGQPDIDPSIIDEGFSQYTRVLFTLNESSTDTAIFSWGDPGLPNIHLMSWDVNNPWTKGMYFRLAQAVSFANSFIENAADLAKSDTDTSFMIEEARFLRAFAYFQLMDMFANVPIVTKLTTTLPEQNSREEVFNFVESELKELTTSLNSSGANEYGRVDQTAAHALLSRLYLNAPVYAGRDMYQEASSSAQAALSGTYSLNTNDSNGNGSAYDELFIADNNSNGAQNEFIFSVQFDGLNSQSWGGTTFAVHAAIGGSMNPSDFGVNGGWAGIRTTKGLVDKFSYSITATDSDGYPTAWSDSRAMFHTDGQNYETEKSGPFKEGYTITKFKNIDSSGSAGSDSSGNHVDTDLPIIRVAEVMLNYAEAYARGGSGDKSTALSYINQLRSRANAPQINSSDFNLDLVMDERARELYWEGLRRPDLIRDNKFVTSTYLWPFKAGAANGMATDDYKKVFPIPEDVILVNPNIKQNPNY
jgi:hypothetical protein